MNKLLSVVKSEMYHFENSVQTFKLIDIYHRPAQLTHVPKLPELNLWENVFPTFMSPSG